ncbi:MULTISPECIES: phage tail protein [Asaia]|uniref:phage tail protein n=1 Tax=Asaia TaxID=91914 RepID=UPI002FC36486
MSRIYQSGQLNTTALTVPDLYVSIVQPQTLLNGVTSGRMGIVGTASWGPVNTPVIIGGMGDYLAAFGPKQAAATDLGLAVNIASLQGASDFRCVRVTDGTDTAATGSLTGLLNLTARYTGTSGNALSMTVQKTATQYQVTLSAPFAQTAEVYSVAIQSSVLASMQSIVSTVNAASKLAILSAVASPGAEPTYPATATLTGGTNGSAPGTTDFIGSDGSVSGAGTGMYALRGQGCALGVLHGLTDTSTFSAQAAFGLGEGVYMVGSMSAGMSVSAAVSAMAASGGASYALKVMHGDWLWWNDDTNGLMLAPPQAFAAGVIANLGPQNASLNKQLAGIAGSQKAGQTSAGGTTTYSTAELSALIGAGLDVIANPAPGGAYWACRSGHNTSLTATVQSDSYTRMTNYLATTLAGGMGVYVGAVVNDTLFAEIRSTILGLLSGMLGQGQLATVNGALPYTVICDRTNNPLTRTALGYVQADIAVQYQGINEKFILNLQGGASVQIASASGSV